MTRAPRRRCRRHAAGLVVDDDELVAALVDPVDPARQGQPLGGGADGALVADRLVGRVEGRRRSRSASRPPGPASGRTARRRGSRSATRPRTAAGAPRRSSASRPAGPTTTAAPACTRGTDRVVRPRRARGAASAGRRRRSGSGGGSRRTTPACSGVAREQPPGHAGHLELRAHRVRHGVGMPATVAAGTTVPASVAVAARCPCRRRGSPRTGRDRWCRRRSASSCWCRGSRWTRW